MFSDPNLKGTNGCITLLILNTDETLLCLFLWSLVLNFSLHFQMAQLAVSGFSLQQILLRLVLRL